ncbi:uncharacterized protein GIQ15_04524 [Arthroderma uncinatum]|uniref:uncharacterized protein n=1 Tax=Arthroderma uncinatum TaxID=74035 RepID=UPI00144A73B5|nr:uncharacterized protein GIQ15_04524 [Arthroderma uncinatum]KAF3481765.1 hypothetical protein GIQ15_04524 [Arthroderma uncinatum]
MRSGIDYLNARIMAHVPETIAELIQELSALNCLLLQGRDFIEQQMVDNTDTKRLSECLSLYYDLAPQIRTLEAYLQQLLPHAHSKRGKLKWLQKKNSIEKDMIVIRQLSLKLLALLDECGGDNFTPTLVYFGGDTTTLQSFLDWLSPDDYSTRLQDILSGRIPDIGPSIVEHSDFREWLENPGAAILCTGMPGIGKTTLCPPNDDDIRKYSAALIARQNTLNTQIRNDTIDVLVQKSNGSFIKARLIFDLLQDLGNNKGSYPAWASKTDAHSLEGLYSQVMARLVHTNSALEIITWVYCPHRPLTVLEIQEAIAPNVHGSTLYARQARQDVPLATLCHNMIVVNSVSNTVTLIHSTFKEFLANYHNKWQSLQLPGLSSPATFLSRKCLAYLCLDRLDGKVPLKLEDLKEELARYPLLEYAANFWGKHAQNIELDDYLELSQALFASEAKTMRAGLLMVRSEKYERQYEEAYARMRPLHICARFGLAPLAKYLISNKAHDIDVMTEDKWTALHWAARSGSNEIVSILLDSKARTESRTKISSWTPLHLASKEGHYEIVKLLLDSKANVEAEDAQGRTPLYLACLSRKETVVQLLLSHTNKADANVYTKLELMPLHCASKLGYIEIVEVLIGYSDINARDGLGYTALDVAIIKGHQSVADLLTRAGAEGKNNESSSSGDPTMMNYKARDWSRFEVDEKKTAAIPQGKLSSTERRDIISKYFLSERRILHRLQHPSVVEYFGFDENPDQNTLLLYMEYCDMGNLDQLHGLPPPTSPCHEFDPYEDSGPAYNEDEDENGFYTAERMPQGKTTPLNGLEVWGLIYQLSSALAYLHYGLSINREGPRTAFFDEPWACIIHRDIKPANGTWTIDPLVLQSIEPGMWIAKICDLGIATALETNVTRLIGTRAFYPPEVLKERPWAIKGDIFCLGRTIQHVLKLQDEKKDSICKFIKGCCCPNPKGRKSSLHIMEEAYTHLQRNGGLNNLPTTVIEQSAAIHSYLNVGIGGYVFQAFRHIAEFLDTNKPFDENARKQRKITLEKLNLLWTDGAGDLILQHPDDSTAAVLVLLRKRLNLEKLLSSGGDINVQWRKSGWTPLHIAAQEGNTEIVRMLVERNAQKTVRDTTTKLPRDYVTIGEILKLLS